MRRALRERDFRRVVMALAASTAGDWIYGTALIVYVYEVTGSPGWVAAAGIFRLAPYIFLSPVAGALADRFDKKKVMVVSDLSRALLMFVLALAAVAESPVAIAIAIAFLSTAAGTPFGPALTGLTPTLVEERDLAAANAGMSTVEHVALIAGPAVGGLLLILGSASIAFALNGVTFLISAALLIGIRSRAKAETAAGERTGLLRQVAEGVNAVTSSLSVAIPVFLFALASLAYGFEIVVLVVVAEKVLDIGSEGVGFLNAGIGLGGVAAAGFTSRLAEDPRSGRAIALGVVACGIPLVLLAATTSPILACVLVAGIGAGNIVLEVMTVTVLQRLVDERVMARVFGILDSIGVIGILIGSLAAPLLLRSFGVRTTLVIIGIAVPSITAILGPTIRKLDRVAAARAAELAPTVDLLDGLGVFDGLSRQTLEQLAAGASTGAVTAGQAIVTEGEPAEDFFVITEGSFEVLASGESGATRTVNRMGAGDYFGEIGLLERIPRTATVRAVGEGSVLRISGDDFLEAANRPRAYSTTLVQGVTSRLQRTHPSYEPTLLTGDAS